MSDANTNKPAAKADVYKVYDTLAKDGQVRQHEIIVKTYPDGREPDTKIYKLENEKGTEMPADHALKFLRDPAFKVERNGERLMPAPKYDPSLPLAVANDQTIANFDELTKVALFKRCKVIPGSEHITVNASVQVMVDFLIADRKKQLQGNLSDAEQALMARMAGGELDGPADQGALKKMLPDSPLLDGQR